MPNYVDAKIIDAAEQDVILELGDSGTAFITIQTGATWDGTLVVQLSNNGGVSWATTNFRTPSGGATGAAYSTANTTASFIAGAAGAMLMKVTNKAAAGGAWVAGSATLWLSTSSGSSAVYLLGGIPAGDADLGSVSGKGGTFTDRSGSISTGGASQQLAAANTSRNYLLIQNLSTENLWINFGTAAVADQPSLRLEPGVSFVMESTLINVGAVHIIGATTGSKFAAKEA